MRRTEEESQAKRRWARWYPKKHDDKLIERWAGACSTIYDECRDCQYMEDCQDLADRLIGSMNVPATGGRKQRTRSAPRERLRYGLQALLQESCEAVPVSEKASQLM
jgi:hypothetical protein